MWPFAADELGKDGVLEAGIPKQKAEFLVTGSAFSPSGEPVPKLPVRAGLGDREKVMWVFGDRYWSGTTEFTAPEPFVAMPLDWEHAFGGEGYDANPLGRGAGPVEVEGQLTRPLPNIEDSSRYNSL